MITKELDVATTAAREAGRIIRRLYGSYRGEITQKGDRADSPLTEADTQSNEVIHQLLRESFPDDGWLSEESADSPDRLSRRRVWIVDPLDGTREFVMHIPELAVAIALVENGTPILGVAYNPVQEQLFSAVTGHPAMLNGTTMTVSDTEDFSRATFLASRSEDERGEWDPYKPHFRVELTGSVAYKLALVAAGKADATFTLTPKHEWDVCASVCLVEAAGGRVTNLEGEPLHFNNEDPYISGLVASNGRLHDGLLELIRKGA